MYKWDGAGSTDSIGSYLQRSGVNRRDFVSLCGKLMVVAPAGLSLTSYLNAEEVAKAVGSARRPSVIWLHMQECTGCTETLLRTSEPGLADLIFNLISLDYHETVMAAAGHQAEKALHAAMDQNDGNFICVVEGSVPTKDGGIYLTIAGKKGIDLLNHVTSRSAAVVAMGSCASWGGVQSQGENPTGAVGVHKLVTNKPVINVPGCPPNPYVFLATALEFAVAGKVPALDDLGRPRFAYDRTIHNHCPRRAHFDAGRFAKQFGDDGHRQGWCLYKLGCKGPATHAACSTRHFNEVVDAWPIGIGHPCFGCTEQDLAFKVPIHDTIELTESVPPDFYPEVNPQRGYVSAIATGVVGAVAGGALVAGALGWNGLKKAKLDDASDETKE
ncbi:MAG: hydrogenase small subunit [Thermoanaerobaculia bacterium]